MATDEIMCPECGHSADEHFEEDEAYYAGCNARVPDEGFEDLLDELQEQGATSIDTDRYTHYCGCTLSRSDVIEKAKHDANK